MFKAANEIKNELRSFELQQKRNVAACKQVNRKEMTSIYKMAYGNGIRASLLKT